MEIKDNKGDSKNRYRITSQKILEYLGLSPNKSNRYRLKPEEVEKLRLMPNSPKIMIYDIETSRGLAKQWWTGKGYTNFGQFVKDPAIISISWKMLGDDTIHHLTWDKNHSDKKMVEQFLEVYNNCDMVVGQNNDNFDNKWIVAQAMMYNFDVNMHVKSLDLYKEHKHIARFLSHSLKYKNKKLGITFKLSHEGLVMWDMIEDGTKEQQEEYLKKMVEYNVGDIIATEELLIRTWKYIRPKMHIGVFKGGERYSCPTCGGTDVHKHRMTTTSAGTIQWIMECEDHGTYRISNREYLNFIRK